VCIAQYGCFCGSLISCFPGMLHRYCLNGLEMVSFAPIIIIIIIIIGKDTISFMQGIYTYIPETNHVPKQ
jgi:hypothetical protein